MAEGIVTKEVMWPEGKPQGTSLHGPQFPCHLWDWALFNYLLSHWMDHKLRTQPVSRRRVIVLLSLPNNSHILASLRFHIKEPLSGCRRGGIRFVTLCAYVRETTHILKNSDKTRGYIRDTIIDNFRFPCQQYIIEDITSFHLQSFVFSWGWIKGSYWFVALLHLLVQ